jgi:hypothetical protein
MRAIHPDIKESKKRKPKARKRKEEDEEEKNLANHLFFFRFSYRNRWTSFIVLDQQFLTSSGQGPNESDPSRYKGVHEGETES